MFYIYINAPSIDIIEKTRKKTCSSCKNDDEYFFCDK